MRRTKLCFEGWCYLVLVGFIVGGAVIREINLLLFVAGVMLGPLLLSWRLLVRMLSRVSVDRSLPQGVGAGELFPVKLKVTNHHRWLGIWALNIANEIRQSNDSTRSVGPPTTSSASFPYIHQGKSSERSFDCCIHDRGVYEFGPLIVSSRFPMGLFRRTLKMGEPSKLFVYPRLGKLRRRWVEAIRPSHLGIQRSQHRPGLTEGEFHSLRDWRNGDSRRWIHWRTSARRNQLTVRQFERRQNRNLAVLLELRTGVNNQNENATAYATMEQMIRFAATVVAHHCRTGSSHMVLGIAGIRSDYVSGTSSATLMRDGMELLATAMPTERDELPALLDQTLEHIDGQTRIVILSTQPIRLDDTDRFQAVWERPEKRHLLSKITCIEANPQKLREFFEDSDVYQGQLSRVSRESQTETTQASAWGGSTDPRQ